MEFISEVAEMKRKTVFLIFTDDPFAHKPLVARLRGEVEGQAIVKLLDARFWDDLGNDLEPANVVSFIGALKRDLIVQHFRSDGYREAYGPKGFGNVVFQDMDSEGNVLATSRKAAQLDMNETIVGKRAKNAKPKPEEPEDAEVDGEPAEDDKKPDPLADAAGLKGST